MPAERPACARPAALTVPGCERHSKERRSEGHALRLGRNRDEKRSFPLASVIDGFLSEALSSASSPRSLAVLLDLVTEADASFPELTRGSCGFAFQGLSIVT